MKPDQTMQTCEGHCTVECGPANRSFVASVARGVVILSTVVSVPFAPGKLAKKLRVRPTSAGPVRWNGSPSSASSVVRSVSRRATSPFPSKCDRPRCSLLDALGLFLPGTVSVPVGRISVASSPAAMSNPTCADRSWRSARVQTSLFPLTSQIEPEKTSKE